MRIKTHALNAFIISILLLGMFGFLHFPALAVTPMPSGISVTVPTPVTAANIQTAVNTVIAAGGGTVNIPSGDWRVDQQAEATYGQPGGAIYVDLETLPAGAWLNILGLYTNTSVTTQNGQVLRNVPNVVLRSYTAVNDNLTSTYATFEIVGSKEVVSNLNNYKSQDKHIRISGLTILGDVINDGTVSSYANHGIALGWVDGYLIDHCAIDGNTGADISTGASKGVISACTITQLYHVPLGGIWGYGIQVGGNFGYMVSSAYGTPTWIQNISLVEGKYDWQGITLNYSVPPQSGPWNSTFPVYTTSSISFTAGPVYIEDSIFNYTRHCVTSSSFAYYVFRHNVLYEGIGTMPFIDTHGGGQWSLAATAYATRGAEIYGNTVNGAFAGQYGVSITGGAALIFNNTFNNVDRGILLGNRNYNSSVPVDPEYINDVWLWSNSFHSIGYSNEDINAGVGVTPNINYFSDISGNWDNGTSIPATSTAPPPSWFSIYAYPHPLTFYEVTVTVSTPVTAAGIKAAADSMISAGGGTVYVPAGDWRVDQQPLLVYGGGGAISIDLESLPSGAWLNIIGMGGNVSTNNQNGMTMRSVPSTILRSYAANNNNLTSTIGTFGITGSNMSYPANFNWVRSAGRHIRISGITVLGYVLAEPTLGGGFADNVGISLSNVDGYLIDHCAVDSNTGSDIGTSASKGVISHTIISQLYHSAIGGQWGYGVAVGGNFGFYSNGLGTPTWIQNVTQIQGKYDWQGLNLSYTVPVNGDLSIKGTTTSISYNAGPVYIEDSEFYECRHTVSSSEYGYYVLRYSVMYGGVGLQMCDAHGGGWSGAANAYATRGVEIYDNTIYGNTASYGTGTYAVGIRGGAGLVFDNVFSNIITGISLGNENYNSSVPTYPEYINDFWIWNNTMLSIGYPLKVGAASIAPGVNYFADIPDSLISGSTPTTPAPPPPGYIRFAYPHPLTTGAAPSAPNLGVTLNGPASGSSIGNYTVTFSYTPIAPGSLDNASLWSNVGGTWQNVANNASALQNGVNTFTYTFSSSGTYLWNVKLYNSTTYVFAPANFTLTIVNGLGVTLNSPSGMLQQHLLSVNFVYTPVSYGSSIINASLYLNVSGTWQNVMNTTTVSNATQNTFTYPLALGNYTFNVKVYNSTTGVFASSNNTFTLVQNWQLTFNWTNWNGQQITSGLTWQLYNGSQLLTYTSGAYALLSGTYRLDTYYGSTLLNSTSLSIATYGNTTVHVPLNILPQTNGFIAINSTVTNMTIISQNSSSLNFVANGTSGPYNITIAVTKQPTYVIKDNNTLVYGVNWTYDSAHGFISIFTQTLSNWYIVFSGTPPPPPPSTFVLTVIVSSNGGNVSGASVIVNGSSPVLTVNGIASFTLASGTYNVSASFQGLNKTTILTLNSADQITFDLSPTVPPPLELYASAIIIAIIVIVAISVLVIRRKH